MIMTSLRPYVYLIRLLDPSIESLLVYRTILLSMVKLLIDVMIAIDFSHQILYEHLK